MTAKIAKKDIEKPDAFQSIVDRVAQYIIDHRRKFYLGSAALALAAVAAAGLYFYSMHYEGKADALYSAAHRLHSFAAPPTSDRESLSRVVNAYEAVIQNYPRSHAAALSHYTLGNIYYRAQDYAKARDSFEAFLSKASGGHLLVPFAYNALGSCYEDQKEFSKAVEAYEKAVSKSKEPFMAAIGYGNMARVYEEMKDPKKALEFYSKALEKTKDPSMAAFIKRKIAALS